MIDDERSALTLLDRVLTGAGHEVSLVDRGEAALQKLAKERFDLVIADKNLPDLDGLEVVRMARGQHPQLQCIIITGFPTPETKETAKALGVHAYVTKPFGILEIVSACDDAIAASRGNAQAVRG